MGKIIAMGGGFDGDDAIELARYVISLTGKEKPNYLQIPTTGYDFADGGSVGRFAKMGCEVDVLYLTHAYMTEEIVKAKIENADIIYVPGGNLEYVMRIWNRTNTTKYLREAYEAGKVLFGSSSGSMCWFRKGFDDCGPADSWMFVDCTDIIPYCNVPHYDSGFWQEYQDFAKDAGMSSICCENEAAICWFDGKLSVMSSSRKPDATAYFFDAENDFRRYDLKEHPEILERLNK